MDVTDYLPMFLAEATEHLQELNLAVVRIEEDPTDTETVNEIFRIAHSFKGMSASMGYEGIAALTHKMEDVFELLRQRTGGLHREAIDVVLECLDALSAAVDSIQSGGDEEIEPAALIARLEGLVRARRADQPAPAPPPAPAPAAVREALAAGTRVLHVRAELAPDVDMPSVRAYMLLSALGEHGDLLGSAPATDEIDGFAGRRHSRPPRPRARAHGAPRTAPWCASRPSGWTSSWTSSASSPGIARRRRRSPPRPACWR